MNISPAILSILAKRGITSSEDIAEYMSPKPKLTYDPFLMKGMDAASDMIIEYARSGRKICIYGDYDADGVTSVSLMLTLLKELTDNAEYYIPSRFEEGYGLNRNAIDKMAERGTELVITVDNGCVAFDEIEYIKEKGMAVIVTDHHNVDERSPDCIMLNPKQPDDTYPFKYLCGCGVAFKLAQAVTRKTGISKKILNSLLDITGIATVGDIVPLTDENRTLVKYGMDRIRRNERPGLRSLLEEIKLNPETVSSYNIAFGIVPHINSCGRMKKADIGVELLTGSDRTRLSEITSEIAGLNTERKNAQDEIYRSAVIKLEEGEKIPDFILYDAGKAHEGVTGIVAGKLKEKYYRPVIIVTDSGDGIAKGTGRSIPGADLHKMLSKYSSLFLRFGGHAGACGFSMKKQDVDYLRESLNADMAEMLVNEPHLLDYVIIPDAVIDADDVTLELARDIRRMEPFGEGNPRPVFEIKNIFVKSVSSMGKQKQYRKLNCMSDRGRIFEAVCFDSEMEGIDSLYSGVRINVFGEIDENVWNGRSSVQIILKQIILTY
jgi:single-stranded-DNA-specific exonuclease